MNTPSPLITAICLLLFRVMVCAAAERRNGGINMSCYREIMNNENLPSQFKKYISVIDLMKSKRQSVPAEQIIPDLLLLSSRDAEYVINALCRYLSEEAGFDFAGENKILNIELPQTESNISDIRGKINDMFILSKGFMGKFKGIICVYTGGRGFNSSFTEVMRYIKSGSEGCIRVIVADDIREYRVRELEKALCAASYRIYTVKGDSLPPERVCVFLGVKLEKYGFTLNAGAKNALKIMVKQLIDSNKLKSLRDADEYLAGDLLFFLLGHCAAGAVTEDIISSYFKQCLLCGKKDEDRHHIGFIDTREE